MSSVDSIMYRSKQKDIISFSFDTTGYVNIDLKVWRLPSMTLTNIFSRYVITLMYTIHEIRKSYVMSIHTQLCFEYYILDSIKRIQSTGNRTQRWKFPHVFLHAI